MNNYKAPKRDLMFVLRDVLKMEEHYAKIGRSDDVSPDFVDAVLDASAQLAEEVLAPTSATGDSQGCTLKDGVVTTPEGFKDAYQQYCEGGWTSLPYPEEFGGQNLPASLNLMVQEFIGSANWAFSMYPGLSQGAMNCMMTHASEDIKQTYLHKMVAGDWTGTMCLTEPHCGSDLGMLRTKAVDNADGTHSITGTKIFISSGEHDLADNIIHLVLARLEGAPQGTKGISLFVVPKYLPDANGDAGERNSLICGAIEEKMGIHGNSTCVMNFDGAKGYMVGEPNRGLNAMFVMMNSARIGTATQGLVHAECAYQASYSYAVDRLQMRSLTGPKNPDGAADPIIVHPDVRRMLLQQKAFTEAGRCMAHWMGQLLDLSRSEGQQAEEAEALLELITPIAKAFMTEQGFESANLGMQIFGGHGYIKEYGVEQQVRDARISMIYEGTTGIQALDLLGRKVMATAGESLKPLIKELVALGEEYADDEQLGELAKQLLESTNELNAMTAKIGAAAMQSLDEVGAASFDYLMYCGYLVYAMFWLRMAAVAKGKLAENDGMAAFYETKIQTAKFYYARVLPRAKMHAECALSGADSLMDMEADNFIIA